MVEGVFQAPFTAIANLAISARGTLAYQPGTASLSRQAPIVWMTQAGALTSLRAAPSSFRVPSLFSPMAVALR